MQHTPKACSCQGGWKCPACVDATDRRIHELEAEVARLRTFEEGWKQNCADRDEALDKAEAAEGKLQAVAELPSVRGLDGREWISASSLEALLKEQSDE